MNLSFVTWEHLTTYTGALVMVLILTELTKALPVICRLPTQLWSYLVSLCVLYPAAYFTGALDASGAVLILLNGAIIALSANGGYDAIQRISAKKK